MPSARTRVTIRNLMILVAALAVSARVVEEWRRYRSRLPEALYPRTYYVGDLIGEPGQEASPPSGLIANPNTAGLETFIERMKSSVTPNSWKHQNLLAALNGDEVPKATPFPPSHSMIVEHTPDGHDRVAAWLRRERKKRLLAERETNINVR